MGDPTALSDVALAEAIKVSEVEMRKQVKRLRLKDRRFNHELTWSLALDDELDRRKGGEDG